jgi:hypothetical protein
MQRLQDGNSASNNRRRGFGKPKRKKASGTLKRFVLLAYRFKRMLADSLAMLPMTQCVLPHMDSPGAAAVKSHESNQCLEGCHACSTVAASRA